MQAIAHPAPAGLCAPVQQRPTARRNVTVQHRAAKQPRRQPLRVAVRAAAEPELPSVGAVDPEDARCAIAVGLKFSNAGNWAQAQVGGARRALELLQAGLLQSTSLTCQPADHALPCCAAPTAPAAPQEYFERALELPGTGLKRWRDKPPALSTGELTSALYNIACCRARLGDVENGLVAISGAVEQVRAAARTQRMLTAARRSQPCGRLALPPPPLALPPILTPDACPQHRATATSSRCGPTQTWRRCASTSGSRG